MELKRFTITSSSTGEWVGSVYADSFHKVDEGTVNFMIGSAVVAQSSLCGFDVSDSGGRLLC